MNEERKEKVEPAEFQLITQINLSFLNACEREADFWTEFQFKPHMNSWKRKYQDFIFSFRDLINKTETNIPSCFQKEKEEIKNRLENYRYLHFEYEQIIKDFHRYCEIITAAGMIDIKKYVPSFREKAVKR